MALVIWVIASYLRWRRILARVLLSEGETFESMLKRFNKKVQQDGILSEFRRREHFESPTVRRKRKAAAKRRKSARSR